MAELLPEELTDAVYRAALEPAAWDDVMQLMRGCFPSIAQTFYFLHLEPRRVRPVCLTGVETRWLKSFDELYFAPDNPWIRVTKFLHRPGVIRTTERLERFLKEAGVLDRSSYYNDWMRPQGFKHNIGNTLLAQDGVVANITLFRPSDMRTFSDDEVRSFEVLSKHMTRSLQIAVRLEQPEKSAVGVAAFDALPQAVALVDRHRHVLYANATMEVVLRRGHGLVVRDGELNAIDPGAQQRFAELVSSALAADHGLSRGITALTLPCRDQGHLSVRVVPVTGAIGRVLPLRPTVLLLATECSGRRALSCAEIGKLYGCTLTEARLAQLVAEGRGLRRSAESMGVTYGTARSYLKIVFQKVGVRTQAQLVAKMLGDSPASRLDRGAVR
jgi:DNA-binding CsgD family transcriptional regulator/PAS domain-containing protein